MRFCSTPLHQPGSQRRLAAVHPAQRVLQGALRPCTVAAEGDERPQRRVSCARHLEFDGVAAEIIRRSHALPAGSLQLRQQHKLAVPAGDGQALLREGDRRAGGLVRMTGRGLRPVNLEMRAVQVRRGDGPRIKAAHLIDNVPDRLRPVDGRKLLREHRSQRCHGRILRRAGRRTRLDGMQCIGQQRRADGGQPRQQGRGISSGSMGVFRISMISPSSIPAERYIAVTPVSSRPFRMAHCAGAEPRSAGRMLVWMLMQPSFGMSSTRCGRIFP